MLVKTQDLKFNYNGEKRFNFPDFEIDKGEHMLLAGESGSGKTTLLHLLAGLIQPASGNVIINNQEISKLKPSEMDKFRGKNIGLIFQKHYFLGAISMRQNLLSAQTLPGFEPYLQHIEILLETLGIKPLEHKKPAALSQGELQRFSVARALANKPLLLLADEPTSSLDDRNCRLFMDLIKSAAEQFRSTLMIATHDARLFDQFPKRYQLSLHQQ